MGPHEVIWIPTQDCPDVKGWLEKHYQMTPHPGWIMRDRGDGSYSHEKAENAPKNV
jgi:hypothetical protein